MVVGEGQGPGFNFEVHDISYTHDYKERWVLWSVIYPEMDFVINRDNNFQKKSVKINPGNQ